MRRGDSCGAPSGYPKLANGTQLVFRACPPLAEYLDAAEDVRRATGFASLMVATDDDEAAERVQVLAQRRGFTVSVSAFNRSIYEAGPTKVERRKDFDHALAAREVGAGVSSTRIEERCS